MPIRRRRRRQGAHPSHRAARRPRLRRGVPRRTKIRRRKIRRRRSIRRRRRSPSESAVGRLRRPDRSVWPSRRAACASSRVRRRSGPLRCTSHPCSLPGTPGPQHTPSESAPIRVSIHPSQLLSGSTAVRVGRPSQPCVHVSASTLSRLSVRSAAVRVIRDIRVIRRRVGRP